jgi:hypothetical protein
MEGFGGVQNLAMIAASVGDKDLACEQLENIRQSIMPNTAPAFARTSSDSRFKRQRRARHSVRRRESEAVNADTMFARR